MADLDLTLACGRYDRTWPLLDGRVRPEGIRLTVVPLEPEECFWRMLRYQEFDAAEMSLASYTLLRSKGDRRFVAIPAFLSRSFRHSSIYLPNASPIREPADLAGARIGVPEYQMTASVWTRGMLTEDMAVDVSDVTWCTGGLEQPGRVEREPLQLPERIHVQPIPTDATLSTLLADGSIDALMAPRVPSAFRRGAARRLFPDYAARERDYFARTGIFPIMHLVVIRAELLERRPWAAQSLFKAMNAAKDVGTCGVADAPALRYTMPFLLAALEEQEQLFGADPWPYGIEANRPTLQTFVSYLQHQGLLAAPIHVDDLFARSTAVESRI